MRGPCPSHPSATADCSAESRSCFSCPLRLDGVVAALLGPVQTVGRGQPFYLQSLTVPRPTHLHAPPRTVSVASATRQDYEGRGEAGKYTVQFVSKSADGIAHYLKHHAAKMREVFKPFAANATIKRRVLKMTRQVFPVPNTRVQTAQPPPNAEPKLLGSSRRPPTADAFQGAYGKKSDQSEFSTTRFSDFHPHKAGAQPTFEDTKKLHRMRDVDVRFFVRPPLPSSPRTRTRTDTHGYSHVHAHACTHTRTTPHLCPLLGEHLIKRVLTSSE